MPAVHASAATALAIPALDCRVAQSNEGNHVTAHEGFVSPPRDVDVLPGRRSLRQAEIG